MAKKSKMPKLGLYDREKLAKLITQKEFKVLEKLLRIKQQNLVFVSWLRCKSTDEDLKEKKAYWEGQYDFIKKLLQEFKDIKTKLGEED